MSDEDSAVQPPDLIFILAGQSNMAGRGNLAMALPPSSQVLMLSGENGEGQWKVAREPTHADVDAQRLRLAAGSTSKKECGIGPALFFGEHLISLITHESCGFTLNGGGEATASSGAGGDLGKRSCPVRIGLVPAAIGGTQIDEWQPDAALFEHMLAQRSRALSLAHTGVSSSPSSAPATITAILWHQGESDADTRERAGAYGCKLATFIKASRASMRPHHVPIIVCGIGGDVSRVPFKDGVRAAQLAACDDLRDSEERADGYVETNDLEFQDDGLHLTAAAAGQLGMRLAEAVWRVPSVRLDIERVSAHWSGSGVLENNTTSAHDLFSLHPLKTT